MKSVKNCKLQKDLVNKQKWCFNQSYEQVKLERMLKIVTELKEKEWDLRDKAWLKWRTWNYGMTQTMGTLFTLIKNMTRIKQIWVIVRLRNDTVQTAPVSRVVPRLTSTLIFSKYVDKRILQDHWVFDFVHQLEVQKPSDCKCYTPS
jgi:hypothetical protein